MKCVWCQKRIWFWQHVFYQVDINPPPGGLTQYRVRAEKWTDKNNNHIVIGDSSLIGIGKARDPLSVGTGRDDRIGEFVVSLHAGHRRCGFRYGFSDTIRCEKCGVEHVYNGNHECNRKDVWREITRLKHTTRDKLEEIEKRSDTA